MAGERRQGKVHDSQVFLELLSENTSRDVSADSAYFSEETQQRLKALGYRAHLQGKGQKNHPLSEWEKQGNRRRSRIRSRVEHIFGVQLQGAGTLSPQTLPFFRHSLRVILSQLFKWQLQVRFFIKNQNTCSL